MFGIELDGIKKLEIGFVSLIILGIGYFTYQNWGFWSGKEVDRTIVSYVEERPGPVLDPTKPRSAANEDVRLRTTVTVFANHDGKLKIVEYPNDPARAGKLAFRFEPDVRRKDYLKWQDQWIKIDAIKDPARKVLAYNGYLITEKRPAGMMGYVDDLNRDQRRALIAAAKELREQILYLDDAGPEAIGEMKLYDKVTAALEKYRATDGDPSKDKNKAKLAYDVVDAAMQYLGKQQAARLAAVDKYVESIYSKLEEDQRKKLADAVGQINPRLRGPLATPGRRRASAPPLEG